MKIIATKDYMSFAEAVSEVMNMSFSLRQALESLLYSWDSGEWAPAVDLGAYNLGDVVEDIAARIAEVRAQEEEQGLLNRLHPEVWAGMCVGEDPTFFYTTSSGICRMVVSQEVDRHEVDLEFISKADRLEESSIGRELLKSDGWIIRTITEGGEFKLYE